MENKNLFEVGVKVWDFRYGWGKVVEIKNDGYDYPVKVEFDETKDYCLYSKEGKEFHLLARTLFFEEIPIPASALERPRKTAEEMVKECIEVGFESGKDNYYIYAIYNSEGKCINLNWGKTKFNKKIGTKYITIQDAERIISECKENN